MSDSDVVIRVEGLGKKYSLHHEQNERYTALRDVVARQAKTAGRLLNPFTLAGQLRKSQRQAAQEHAASEEEFWALKDVSFEIRRGERVGIIGRNGAGKSTLLKILSRITEPTTGRVEIRGRVASLLEVGTGFHPELTGRENIYLNGAILGMTRQEIISRFAEVVEFAEVERFLDTPVKRYSSGMYVRLAFSIAAHLEPEILIVDEVLAVGDKQFQNKCIGKMKEVSSSNAKTILLVSHNMAAIKSVCKKAILIHQGSVIEDGKVEDAVSKLIGTAKPPKDTILGNRLDRKGDMRLRFTKVSVTCANTENLSPKTDEPVSIKIEYITTSQINQFNVSIIVTDLWGQAIARLSTIEDDSCLSAESNERGTINCRIQYMPLIPGKYSLLLAASVPPTYEYLDYIENAAHFEVCRPFLEPGRSVPSDGILFTSNTWEKTKS